MLTIQFINDETGTELLGNYDVRVFINTRLIWNGRLESYNRLLGWKSLVKSLSEMLFALDK